MSRLMSRLKKTAQEVKAASPWDWLLQESERDQRERRAYVEACELDRNAEYDAADEVLRLPASRMRSSMTDTVILTGEFRSAYPR
jgi:hypothetical protein